MNINFFSYSKFFLIYILDEFNTANALGRITMDKTKLCIILLNY